jgi:hypothetical protein
MMMADSDFKACLPYFLHSWYWYIILFIIDILYYWSMKRFPYNFFTLLIRFTVNLVSSNLHMSSCWTHFLIDLQILPCPLPGTLLLYASFSAVPILHVFVKDNNACFNLTFNGFFDGRDILECTCIWNPKTAHAIGVSRFLLSWNCFIIIEFRILLYQGIVIVKYRKLIVTTKSVLKSYCNFSQWTYQDITVVKHRDIIVLTQSVLKLYYYYISQRTYQDITVVKYRDIIVIRSSLH